MDCNASQNGFMLVYNNNSMVFPTKPIKQLCLKTVLDTKIPLIPQHEP